jgi:hypothetical protein
MPELSSQSTTLASLFDTFVSNQGFGEMLNSNDPSMVENESWMSDSLFGFMNNVDGIPGTKTREYEGPGDVASR